MKAVDISLMEKDHKEIMNHQAYMDVLDCLQPRYDDIHYMTAYRFWRPLQKYPEDLYDVVDNYYDNFSH